MAGNFRGIGIGPFVPLNQLIDYCKLAEKYGIDSFWLGEAYHGRSALVSLSAIATQTSKILLGTSVISVYTRHPALLAMEAATLDELSNGRFILGIGVNTTALVKHGHISDLKEVKEAKPVSAMRDSILISKMFLSGKEVTYEGKVFRIPRPGSKLNFHQIRENLPVYVGSRSPKILQLCGEMADGLIISRSLSSSPDYVKHCIEEVRNGAKISGREIDKIDIAANLNISVSKDSQAARDAVREIVALYICDPNLDATELMKEHSRINDEDLIPVKEEAKKSGHKAASLLVSDTLIEELAIAGTPDEIINKLEKMLKIGVNTLIAFDVLGPDKEEAIKLIGQQIRPHFSKE